MPRTFRDCAVDGLSTACTLVLIVAVVLVVVWLGSDGPQHHGASEGRHSIEAAPAPPAAPLSEFQQDTWERRGLTRPPIVPGSIRDSTCRPLRVEYPPEARRGYVAPEGDAP